MFAFVIQANIQITAIIIFQAVILKLIYRMILTIFLLFSQYASESKKNKQKYK